MPDVKPESDGEQEAAHANPVTPEDTKRKNRREVLKKAGRFVAVTAPAVTLLLAATTKPKKAWAVYV